MSTEYERTHLWRESLAPQEEDPDPDCRDALRVAYRGLRERAAQLAGEVARSLPDFTVHDITHLDALWALAAAIAGPGIRLNPLETFAFGGAVLMHDLGLGLAAYPEGISELEATPRWHDAVAGELRRRGNEDPTENDIRDIDAAGREAATSELLRILHAERAADLGTLGWTDPEGRERFLIEPPELREAVGWILGRIASSHWVAAAELPRTLPRFVNPPTGFPLDWRIDCIKCACLLRLADAAHLDAGRAPPLLRAIRSPAPGSDVHWAFQQRLHRAVVVGDRVEITGSPFPVAQADAWWQARDAVRALDRELHAVDVLLADLGMPRFQARMVVGVDDPVRFADHVPADGWSPVDALVRVTDVARLVTTLGGAQLYSTEHPAPLRELLQNSCDAVRARRVLEQHDAVWGKVVLDWGEDDDGRWIEVRDTGVGMSRNVLTGALLDFGGSLWRSPQLHVELPGLAGSGYESTGRFGIGFFSVFMWARAVRVTTRRFDESPDTTLTLEFRDGLRARPLVRPAAGAQRLVEGGTCVRLWLHDGIFDADAVYCHGERRCAPAELLAHVCPTSEVDLYAGAERAVAAGDWRALDEATLLARLASSDHVPPHELQGVAKDLRDLHAPTGELLGRAALQPAGGSHLRGVVTVGGLVNGTVEHMAGVVIGERSDIARRTARPAIGAKEIARWASEQAPLASSRFRESSVRIAATGSVIALGGAPGPLPLVESADGYLNADQIGAWSQSRQTIVLVDRAPAGVEKLLPADFDPENDVLVIRTASNVGHDRVIAAIASGWGIAPEATFRLDSRNGLGLRLIGRGDGKSIFGDDFELVEHHTSADGDA